MLSDPLQPEEEKSIANTGRARSLSPSPGQAQGATCPNRGAEMEAGRGRGDLFTFPIPLLRKPSTNPCFWGGFRARANPGAAGINNRIALHRGGGGGSRRALGATCTGLCPASPLFYSLISLIYLFLASPRDANASPPHGPGWVGSGWLQEGRPHLAGRARRRGGSGDECLFVCVCVCVPAPRGNTATPLPGAVPSSLAVTGSPHIPARLFPPRCSTGRGAVRRRWCGPSRQPGGGAGRSNRAGGGRGWKGRCRAGACSSICWCRGVRGAIFVSNKRRRGRRSTRVPCEAVG